MIFALDIETARNEAALALMPVPKPKLGNTKDPAKIAEKVAEAKLTLIEKAALNPLIARVICYATAGDGVEGGDMLAELDDDSERTLLQGLFRDVLGKDEMRIITHNGIDFDLPFIYKRALILGVDPTNFNAPPLQAWTKKYSTDRHYDLMKIWGNWGNMDTFVGLDMLATMILGEGKIGDGLDKSMFHVTMQTDEGRAKIAEYNIRDAQLTYRLWQRFNGFLFV